MKIKNKNIKKYGSYFDFELEDGTLLHTMDWNGEVYTVKKNGEEITYKPIYKFEIDDIDLDSIEENSAEWNEAIEIIEFKEIY